MRALATKEIRENLALLAPLAPLALQGPQLSFQSAVTAQLLQQSRDPEDQLDHLAPRAPRDHQELMESQVILGRMEKRVLMDLQASQEPQVTLDLKERRETVVRVNLDPGDLQDLQDQDSDLLLWTWKDQGSLIWNLFGDCLVCPAPLVPLVLLVPLQQAQQWVLGRSDHQERTGRPVNLACLVCPVKMVSLEFLVPREKRVIQVSWVYLEQLDRRELKETLVYQGLQESPDWLVCLDLLDQLGHLGLPGLLDRVIGLDLMTWRALVEVLPMDFLVSEDQKENRVLLACLDFRVNLGSRVF